MMFCFVGGVNMRDMMCTQLCMNMSSPFPVDCLLKFLRRSV